MIAALLDHLWQSTLFCGVVWVIARLCRSNSAALRHGLWLTASLKFLVPFAALYGLGALAGLPAAVEPHFFEPAVQAAVPVVTPTTSFQVAAPEAGPGVIGLLAAIWLLGAFVIAVRWMLAWRAADLQVRAARSAPGAPPDARLTDAAVEPAVVGSFHQVVLLPVALLGKLTAPQMNAVLTHEREHIRRYDNLTANLHRLVETLFWFHPAVWWIGRQLVEERERACDEAVIESGHDGAEYAAGILEVCRHCVGRPRVPYSVSALSGNLAARIRRILAGAPPAAAGFAKVSALLLGALACAGIPLITGAADGTLRRATLLALNTRALESAEITVVVATRALAQPVVAAGPREVWIRDSSLRDMVALSFEMQSGQVKGDGDLLDSPRYDVRFATRNPVSDPHSLDPSALRGLVTRLLAERFDLEVYVNQRCQSPCGRLALAGANSAD